MGAVCGAVISSVVGEAVESVVVVVCGAFHHIPSELHPTKDTRQSRIRRISHLFFIRSPPPPNALHVIPFSIFREQEYKREIREKQR